MINLIYQNISAKNRQPFTLENLYCFESLLSASPLLA